MFGVVSRLELRRCETGEGSPTRVRSPESGAPDVAVTPSSYVHRATSPDRPSPRRIRQVDRQQSLEMAVGQIEKNFGKGAIMRLGERPRVGIEAIPTGALALDLALGIGGLPRGRVVEIFGPESSGKSTLAMHVVAEAQRNGGVCAYIDAEHAMDPM